MPGDRPEPLAVRRDFVVGLFCGLGVALIWSAWLVMTRRAVTTSLAPQDVTFLRYAVSSLFLAPIAWVYRSRLRSVPLPRALTMVIGAGVPFMLLSSVAMQFAPAAHGATLQIGMNPIFVALLSVAFLGERLARLQRAGIAMVLGGVGMLALDPFLADPGSSHWRGDLLFVCAALLFAGFTVAQRQAGLSALQAIALVNVTSFLLYAVPYFTLMSPRLLQAPLPDLLAQAFAQGIANALLALFLYAEAVRRLGSTRAAVIGALVPAVTMVLGAVFLGETPSGFTVFAAACVTAGVAFVVVARKG